VPIDDTDSRPSQAHGVVDYFEDFRKMWTRAMAGFLRHAGPGDCLVFAPELLSGTYYYARRFPDAGGALAEETDRFQQALLYRDTARQCWAAAASRI
jgi:hypothetical protein